MNKYLVVLLNDRMGGAENVASQYANFISSDIQNEVTVFFLNKARFGENKNLCSDIKTIYGNSSYLVFSFFKLLKYLLKHRDLHLIYTTHIHTNATVSLFRKLGILRVKRFISRESTVPSNRFVGLKKIIIDRLYGFYGPQDLIVCQTQEMKDALLNSYPKLVKNNCHVIPNPVNDKKKKWNGQLNSGELKFISVGRLIKLKNFESLIEAISLFQNKSGINVQLTILGDGPESNSLLKFSKKFTNIVISFAGKVNNVNDYMNESHIGISSSLVEGFPNVLLEMMASGVPYIISTPSTGAISEIQGIVTTKGFKPEHIYNAINAALERGPFSFSDYDSELSKRNISAFSKKIDYLTNT